MKTTKVLPIGTKVKIKNDVKNFMFYAGKIMTITKHVHWTEAETGYECDEETGIFLNADFSKIISKP